jgi:hypothetical protein
VQLSLNDLAFASELLGSILMSCFASADEPTVVNLAPGPIGRVIEESLLIFGWVAN